MNVEEFRNYCMALGDDVTEKFPFGKFSKKFDSTLVFYVRNHMFCSCDIDDFNYVNLKATAEEIDGLSQYSDDLAPTINPVLKDWIKVRVNDKISDKRIYQLISSAYNIIKKQKR